MQEAAISFALVLILEAIVAIVQYLKKRLYHHLNRDTAFSFDMEPEYG